MTPKVCLDSHSLLRWSVCTIYASTSNGPCAEKVCTVGKDCSVAATLSGKGLCSRQALSWLLTVSLPSGALEGGGCWLRLHSAAKLHDPGGLDPRVRALSWCNLSTALTEEHLGGGSLQDEQQHVPSIAGVRDLTEPEAVAFLRQ